jgi:hypothetical protein
MKMTRYSEPRILAILRQAEGGVPVPVSVSELCLCLCLCLCRSCAASMG